MSATREPGYPPTYELQDESRDGPTTLDFLYNFFFPPLVNGSTLICSEDEVHILS